MAWIPLLLAGWIVVDVVFVAVVLVVARRRRQRASLPAARAPVLRVTERSAASGLRSMSSVGVTPSR